MRAGSRRSSSTRPAPSPKDGPVVTDVIAFDGGNAQRAVLASPRRSSKARRTRSRRPIARARAPRCTSTRRRSTAFVVGAGQGRARDARRSPAPSFASDRRHGSRREGIAIDDAVIARHRARRAHDRGGGRRRSAGRGDRARRPRSGRLLARRPSRGSRHAGISVTMLTGDHEATAAAVARAVGIEHWRSGVLPAAKADAVREAKRVGRDRRHGRRRRQRRARARGGRRELRDGRGLRRSRSRARTSR